jgi:hypothetical protein
MSNELDIRNPGELAPINEIVGVEIAPAPETGTDTDLLPEVRPLGGMTQKELNMQEELNYQEYLKAEFPDFADFKARNVIQRLWDSWGDDFSWRYNCANQYMARHPEHPYHLADRYELGDPPKNGAELEYCVELSYCIALIEVVKHGQ